MRFCVVGLDSYFVAVWPDVCHKNTPKQGSSQKFRQIVSSLFGFSSRKLQFFREFVVQLTILLIIVGSAIRVGFSWNHCCLSISSIFLGQNEMLLKSPGFQPLVNKDDFTMFVSKVSKIQFHEFYFVKCPLLITLSQFQTHSSNSGSNSAKLCCSCPLLNYGGGPTS